MFTFKENLEKLVKKNSIDERDYKSKKVLIFKVLIRQARKIFQQKKIE